MFRSILITILVCAATMAQHVALSGEVAHDGPVLRDDLMVELYDQLRHTIIGRAPVASQGRFDLGPVPPGNYQLRITTMRGEPLSSEFITVGGHSGPLLVRLPDSPRARPAAGTVSAARLAHRVPRKAEKEFRRALKAGPAEAIAHCEKALAIDPDYFEARHLLATLYMRQNNYGNAEVHFQLAARLDPSSAEVLTGHAGALCAQGRCREAEIIARRAAAVQPLFLKAHYFVGLIRHQLRLHDEETLRWLDRAAPQFPKARILADAIRCSARPVCSAPPLHRYP
jgi:tetratricopeptide (TPR) repeat protein